MTCRWGPSATPHHGSAVDTGAAISVSDTGGYYAAGGGSPARVPFGKSFNPSDIPANGTDTVTVSASGYPPKTFIYTVVDGVIGTAYFLPSTSVISTSMIAGSVLGSIACTTPNNAFTATVSDPSSVLAISGRTLQLRRRQQQAASACRFHVAADGRRGP